MQGAEMKNQWTALAIKTASWLMLEVLLNLVGLDNLADYSEFVFGRYCAVDSAIGTALVVQAS